MPGRIRRLIAVAAVVVGIAGCSGTGQDPTAVNNGGFQDGNGNIQGFAVGHRQLVGDVAGTTLQDRRLDLSSYRGDVVVVNFWSADCAPCHGEARAFRALANEDAGKGVRFVGIDERDNKSAALAFESQYNVTYPSLFDPTDAFLLDFPGAVPAATPFTIILDRAGRIAVKVNGALDYTTLRNKVNGVLAESA